MALRLPTGREIKDLTVLDVLENTARLEHELGLLPHVDPEVASVCREKH